MTDVYADGEAYARAGDHRAHARARASGNARTRARAFFMDCESTLVKFLAFRQSARLIGPTFAPPPQADHVARHPACPSTRHVGLIRRRGSRGGLSRSGASLTRASLRSRRRATAIAPGGGGGDVVNNFFNVDYATCARRADPPHLSPASPHAQRERHRHPHPLIWPRAEPRAEPTRRRAERVAVAPRRQPRDRRRLCVTTCSSSSWRDLDEDDGPGSVGGPHLAQPANRDTSENSQREAAARRRRSARSFRAAREAEEGYVGGGVRRTGTR